MVGTGIGDALGSPVEGWTPEDIRNGYGGAVRSYEPAGPGRPGTLTDDTQLTLCLAQSIVEHGRLEPDDLARRFSAWLPIGRGIGWSTTESILAYQSGRPWWKAGIDSAGNGAAMRTAPIGLLHPVDVDALRRDAALAAVVTHADPMAVASVVAQSWTIAYLLHTEPGRFDVADYLASLSRVLGDVPDPGHPERRVGAKVPVRLLDRILEVGERLDQSPQEVFALTHNGAFVLESLPAALWCFLRSPEDPERVIVTAVNGGYDADTVGAMAGAVVGAYLGEKAFPEEWLTGLEYVDGLERLGERIFAMTGLPGDPTPWRDPGPTTNDRYAPVVLAGKEYPTLEHARRAAPARDADEAERIRFAATPGDARRMAGVSMYAADDEPLDVADLERRLAELPAS
jgi:ADP-ribosylglycohydrolase